MDLLASGAANQAREIERMARRSNRNNSKNAVEAEPIEEEIASPNSNDNQNEEENSTNTGIIRTADEMMEDNNHSSTSRNNSTQARNVIEPINPSNINWRKFTRFKEITLKELGEEDPSKVNRKTFIDLQLL